MDLKSILSGAYGDRRLAFSRNTSFRQAERLPNLSRSDSTISIAADDDSYEELLWTLGGEESKKKESVLSVLGTLLVSLIRSARFGSRPMKRLTLMISLNVAYSITELMIGLLTGRVGLVSDAIHLTFGCGLLTFSLFAMANSQKKTDGVYTYGYKRLEILAAFTNALFLLFMSFSLAVEALHAFIQDESEHKSAVKQKKRK